MATIKYYTYIFSLIERVNYHDLRRMYWQMETNFQTKGVAPDGSCEGLGSLNPTQKKISSVSGVYQERSGNLFLLFQNQ